MKKILFFILLIPVLILAQIESSFEGNSFNGEKPPDPVIAVGNNHIMLVVNREYSIYDKTSNHTLIKTESLAQFFNTISPTPGSIFDPKIVYDHDADRFILLAIDGNHKTNYLLAVSTTDDPTGTWYKYSITGTIYDLDYPGLGFDENSIILTSNSRSGSLTYSDLTILKKSEIYSNNKNYQKDFKDIANGSFLKPARVIGTNPTKFYLVNTTSDKKVRIWTITNPLGGSNASLSIATTISLGNGYNSPQNAVQKGESEKIKIDDVGSSISDIVCKDKILYGAYTVKNTSGNGSSIKYFAVDIDNNYNVKTNGLIENTNKYYYFPVIHPDSDGNMILVFNKSSSNDYVGIAYTKGNANSNTHELVTWLKQGVDGYKLILQNSGNRWGDYSGIAMDPSNNNRIWIYGEWAKKSNEWSTWVGEIKTSETKDFYFTNKYLTTNIGGSLTVNNVQVNSGNSTPLETGVTYQATTNNERFPNWNSSGINYKQNNWDDKREELFLEYNFKAKGIELNHKAVFEELKYSKVALSAENTTQQSSGVISFNDPWYVKSNGTQYHPSNSSDKDWINSTTGYYEPTGKYGATEKGVFLGQGYDASTNDWNPPYYSVKAVSPQTININGKDHDFYFQNWETSSSNGVDATFQNANQLETPVVFNNPGATVKAVMKGHLLSSTKEALASNSQRAIVTAGNGYKHLVYESMGNIWYTYSSDNGATWSAEKKINRNDSQAKQPSISCSSDGNNLIYITYQSDKSTYGFSAPVVQMVQIQNNQIRWQRDVYYLNEYTYDSNPVVGAQNGLVLTVLKESSSLGLRAVEYFINSSFNISMSQSNIIPSTYSGSINQALAVNRIDHKYYLAYQEGTTSIIYKEWNSGSNFSGLVTQNISSGAGSNYNKFPSISQLGGNIVVSWMGQLSYYTNTTMVRRRVNGVWTNFNNFGVFLDHPVNNSAWIGSENAVIAWHYSYYSQATYFVKLINGVFSQQYTLPETGIVDLSDGSNIDNIKAVVNKTSGSAPYDVEPLTYSFNYLSKTKTESDIKNTRKATIVIDGVEYTYFFGEVSVGDKNIDFVDYNSKGKVGTSEQLNEIMMTKPFSLAEGDEIKLTAGKKIVGADNKASLLKFPYKTKLELMEQKTQRKIADIKTGLLSKDEGLDSVVVFLSMDSGKLTSGDYYIRAKIDYEEDYPIFITDEKYEDIAKLLKIKREEIELINPASPSAYSLSQNYPNPFNPSTEISYGLPEDSKVVLKIYDILGNEITTLVNGVKTAGMHRVSFNTSSINGGLASGVYIYRIVTDKYTSSKKMILLR